MDKPYFLLVEISTGKNSKPVEIALANYIKDKFDGSIWSNTLMELSDKLLDIICDHEKTFRDPIIMGHKFYEEDGCKKFLLFGIFKVTVHPIHRCIPRYHVQMPDWYMPYKYPAWKLFTEEQRKKALHDELSKVSNFLEGNANNANMIITQFKEDYPGWKIEVIDYVPKKSRKEGENV